MKINNPNKVKEHYKAHFDICSEVVDSIELNLISANFTHGQTHSNNYLAICRRIV